MKGKWGQNLKRYAIFFFSEHVLLTELEKKIMKKRVEEYSLFSIPQGTIEHTLDFDVIVCFMVKILPLISKISSSNKIDVFSLSKSWSMLVHHHMVIWDLEFCAPSLVKMDNGSIST